jgi:uncharacterized membrane protein
MRKWKKPIILGFSRAARSERIQPMSQAARPNQAFFTPARLEAFSDGVIAIAITLLIIELHLPEIEAGLSLWNSLQQILPNIAAFLISFMTIGVMWVNHHNLFKVIRHVDHTALVLNALLLLMITFVNFPTAVLGELLLTDEFGNAMIFYTGTFAVTAAMYSVLWRYAAYKHRLLGENPEPSVVRTISRDYLFGLLAYLSAFAISFISPMLALIVTFGLAVFFVLPSRRV